MTSEGELDVVLRTNDDLTLFQYPGRGTHRRFVPKSVKIKPENGFVSIIEELDSVSGPNFDPDRAEHLAEVVDGNMDEELEKRIFPNRRFDHLTLEGKKQENKANYCAAIVRNGKLILFPIKNRYQLRPRLRYMDKADRVTKSRMVKSKDDQSSDEEEAATTKTKTTTLKANVRLLSEAYQPDPSGYLARQRAIADEEWKNLDIDDEDPLAMAYDHVESVRKVPEISSVEGYLGTLSQLKIESNESEDPNSVTAIRDQVMQYLWNGKGVSWTTLVRQFPSADQDDLETIVGQLCWHMTGFYSLKGTLKYRNDFKLASGRDRVIHAINKGIPETYTTVKKNAVTNLAIYSDGLWRLIEKPEDPDLVSQNSRLSFQLDKKLEERVRGFKPSRSPARSPARGSPKIVKVQTQKQLPPLVKMDTSEPPPLSVKTEKIEKELRVESPPMIVKTEKGVSDSNGDLPDGGDQNGIIIKAEKNTSVEIVQLEEPLVNRIVSYFEKNFVSIETVKSISTNLGVQIDNYEWPELPSGKRLLYLEDRIAYCQNAREILIIQLYRDFLKTNKKVKKQELFEAVRAREGDEGSNLTEKLFGALLQKFSYAQGPYWHPKPKL